MPEPTLLSDIIQPAWQALTPEQRTCWHFWAAANPITDANNELRVLYGQQAHYVRNAQLALASTPALIQEPPTDPDKPQPIPISAAAWPISARITGTTTARGGYAFVVLDAPLAADRQIVVTQGYIKQKTGNKRPPRIRHVIVADPETDGALNLRTPSGYFATTAGDNRYATIQGKTARRRPDLPLGNLKITSTTTGETIRQAIPNPTGGAPTGSNRPRATQVNPTPGDHFP